MLSSAASIRAVAMHGRLGNQLFQFAALRSITPADEPVLVQCLQAGAEPLDDALHPGSFRRLTARESLWLRQLPVIPPARRYLAGLDRRIPRTGFGRLIEAREYREPCQGSFDPGFSEARAPVLYKGFFQHEDYFLHHAELIEGSFRPPSGRCRDLVRAAQQEVGRARSPVAVVVRAGLDYERLGWALPLSWYQEAARMSMELVSNPAFVIFSDIPLAADALAAALLPVAPTTSLARATAVDQLHAIGAMDHAIVSSSSFAWWGAWLGDLRSSFSTERCVIAPDPWIRAGLATAPRRWHLLDAEMGMSRSQPQGE